MDDLLGPNGQIVTAGTLQAELATQAQRQADATMAQYFGPGYELNRYALDDVFTVGRRVV